MKQLPKELRGGLVLLYPSKKEDIFKKTLNFNIYFLNSYLSVIDIFKFQTHF